MDPKTRYKVRRVVSRGTPSYQLGHYEMTGKPGAGKSTDQGAIKRLIDPSSGDLLTLEKGTFLQNLLFHAVPVFDNLQRIDALLGAIFDALSAALRHFDPAATPPDFRLGDWALYAAGVYKHAGWDQLDADLAGIERTRSEAVVDGSPVARAVMRMVKSTANFRVWEGTPRDLYTKCRDVADDAGELAIFLRAPNTFTARLREATQALSEHGIRVESGKPDRHRWVKISRDSGRDDATPKPSRRDDAGTIDRPGQSRYHSGNDPIRDGRDDTSGNLYGGPLLGSKEVEDNLTPEAAPVHHEDGTVPTVPAASAPPARVDAYDAVLDEVHDLAFRCYAYQIRYAQAQNRLSPDNPPYPDPHDLAFRETSSLYAASMSELRRDGLRGLARELRGGYRALRAANV